MGIVEVLTELAEAISGLFVKVFSQLTTIFFTITETGFTLTPLGYIALIGLVLSIVYRLFNFVRGLIRTRG